MWELTAIGTPYPGNSLGFRLEKNTFAVLKNIQSESQTKNKLFPLPCGPVLLRRIPFLLTAVERASSSVFRVHVHRGLNRNSSPPRPHAPVSKWPICVAPSATVLYYTNEHDTRAHEHDGSTCFVSSARTADGGR